MNKPNNLAVFTDTYPQEGYQAAQFVKTSTDVVANKFDNVYVFVPTNYRYLPRFLISRFFPNGREKDESTLKSVKYRNIYVYRVLAFPLLSCKLVSLKKYFNLFSIIFTILYKRISFSLIHCHFLEYSGFYSRIISKLFNKPYLITVHESNLASISKYSLLKTLSDAKKIIVPIESRYEHLKKFSFFSNVKLVRHSVDTDLFTLRQNEKMFNKIRLLNVANFKEHHKKQTYLIKLFFLLQAIIPDIELELALIGKGPDMNSCIELIRKLKLTSSVHVLPEMKPNFLVNQFQSCDVFVFPSTQESTGIVQLEAMSCGKPVVAFYNGASEYIIRDRVFGRIVKKRNSIIFLSSLVDVIMNLNKYDPHAIRGHIINNYSQKIYQREMLEIYTSALQN